jgi:hypothetical protein
MINSNQKWWGVVALALMCFAPCAFADSSLTMTGAGSNVMEGVYVGPYYATVNGAANTPVICDDFADESYIGSSWNYTANNFSTLGSALWGKQTSNYETAAWLTLEMLSLNSNANNATQVGYISYAIWSLFDPGALGRLNWTEQQGVQTALSQVPSNLTPDQFANLLILTPQGCTVPGTCAGQEFFMLVPEGGTTAMYLLLAGVACFGAILFRRRRQAPVPTAGMA